MKKRFKMLAMLLSLMLVFALLPGCGGGDEEFVIPDEIQELMDVSEELAIKYAKMLDGEWGDMHEAMMQSGQEDGYADFDEMRDILAELLAESGANYLYALYPTDPDDVWADFMITVDASDDPDEFGVEYEAELGMVRSWNQGLAKTSPYAWEDDNGYHWSAYAPIHDSNGDVVAVLGLDYPADIVEELTEWNYDSDDWTEFEW
jgi:hypothetical protein